MDLIQLLRALDAWHLPDGEYAITTSGVLAVRGIREANDLDVVVTRRLWAELARRHPPDEGGKIRLGEHVEVVGPGSPVAADVEAQIARAELIGGHRYVSLPDVRRVKQSLGRPKDRRDRELIDAYLASRDEG